MGEACSHLSEEERQVIRIEVGNGTGVRKMARLPGRSPSSISREIRRNMWFPVQRERVLTAVPAEASEDGPVDGPLLHRRPRAAQGRPQARQTAQAPPPVMRPPVVAGGGAGVAAGGRRVSRFPDGFPSPSVRRSRVRPPHAPARRAGRGHVLRRPVLQPAAGRQREREWRDPPVSARTRRDPDGHGRGTAGIAGPTAVLHLKIDNGARVSRGGFGRIDGEESGKVVRQRGRAAGGTHCIWKSTTRVLNMDDMQVVCGEKRHDATSWAVPPRDRLRAGAFVVREEGCAIPRRVVVRSNRNIDIRVCQQHALCDRRACWDILQTADRTQ